MPDDKGGQGNQGTGQGTGGQQGGQGSGSQDNTQGQGGTPETWDAFLAAQPETIRGLYEQHTTGLTSALKSERQQRQQFEKELRDAAAKLQEGSEARTRLEKMSADLEGANRRAEFYEEAVRPEIGCSNPKLAFLAASDAGLFDSRGNPNWEQVKKQFPELFKGTGGTPPGGAGSGAGGGTPPGGKSNMDDFIRREAGVIQ